MADKDAALEQALKQAKSKKMFFAFVPKGPADGKLIVSKIKILPKQIAETKKEIAGGKPVTGKCFGAEGGSLVFQVAKEPPPSLAAALKKVAHRDAGLKIAPDVQLLSDADDDEQAPDDDASADTPAANPAAVADFTTRLKELMPAIVQFQSSADATAGQQVQAWAAEAGTLAAKRDVEQAHTMLDKVEATVKAGPGPTARKPDTDVHQSFLNVKANLEKKIADLEKHPQRKALEYDLGEIKKKRDAALKLAEPPQKKEKEAMDALMPLFQACDDAKSWADESERRDGQLRSFDEEHNKKILDKKAAVDPMIAALERHPQRKYIAKEIASAKAKVASAVNIAVPHSGLTNDKLPQLIENANKALDALGNAATIAAGAKDKADTIIEMNAALSNPVGSAATVDDYLKKHPANVKLFDEYIAGLDDSTPEYVYEKAIKARFGVDVNQYHHHKSGTDPDVKDLSESTKVDISQPDKSVRRIYELMAKVPASHVENNPRLTEIVRFTDDNEAAMYSSNDKIYLYCGRSDSGNITNLGLPNELPNARDDCKPKPGVPNPTFFDFSTLHEIGHSVDAHVKFMDGHMEKEEFGKWEYTSVKKIAEKAASAYAFDEDYIKDLLSDEKPDVPDKPDSISAKDWADAKRLVDAFCEGIRLKKELWKDDAKCQTFHIGGRVYHQAYKETWVSYDLEARKKGITGYQFRAPAEWFAELYAAYECGNLKDNHPAMAWLKSL